MLPPKPDFLGAQRAGLNPHLKLNPMQKAQMLAMLANTLVEQALKDPRLQPLTVDLQTRPTGWTLTVDIPTPPPDQVQLPH